MKVQAKRKKKKKIYFSRNDLIKSFFLVFSFVVFFLLMTNFYQINLYYNGFGAVFNSPLQVYFFDVGQASASLVIFPNREAMVVDTGSSSTEKEFVEEVDFLLNKNGIEEIEILLLSHSDSDHVGGAVALLEMFQVNQIFRPKIMSTSDAEIENEYGYKTITTNAYSNVISKIYAEPNATVSFVEDEVFSFGETSIQIFSCRNTYYANTNDYSPYIHIAHKDFSFLLTADAGLGREEELLEDLDSLDLQLSIDFLQIAHHGSKNNTSLEFLQAISPRFAFVSAGSGDYPNQEVVEILQEARVEKTFITREVGMIGVGVGDVFFIKTNTNSLDLPLILVSFCCVIFAWLKFIVDKNQGVNRFAHIVKNKISHIKT